MPGIHIFWQINFLLLIIIITSFLILRQQQLYKFSTEKIVEGEGLFDDPMMKIRELEAKIKILEEKCA